MRKYMLKISAEIHCNKKILKTWIPTIKHTFKILQILFFLFQQPINNCKVNVTKSQEKLKKGDYILR